MDRLTKVISLWIKGYWGLNIFSSRKLPSEIWKDITFYTNKLLSLAICLLLTDKRYLTFQVCTYYCEEPNLRQLGLIYWATSAFISVNAWHSAKWLIMGGYCEIISGWTKKKLTYRCKQKEREKAFVWLRGFVCLKEWRKLWLQKGFKGKYAWVKLGKYLHGIIWCCIAHLELSYGQEAVYPH